MQRMNLEKKNSSIIDLSNNTIIEMPVKMSTYFEAERKLLNYNQAVALYGIRRTGKTTVMNQLWNQFKTSKSCYFYINSECSIDDFFNRIKGKDYDYLFIDEITRIPFIDTEIHLILDYCYNVGTKLVIAGTDSYLLCKSMDDSAYGRLNIVNFVPLLFTDIVKIKKQLTFSNFCENGIMFVATNPIRLFASNVYQSISKSIDQHKSILSVMSLDDIIVSIEILISYLIGVKANKLPSPKLSLSRRYYVIDNDIDKFLGDIPKEGVNVIFDIMQRMNLLFVLPEYNLENYEKPTKYNFYCSLPAMYLSILEQNIGYIPDIKANKLGVLFEASMVTQISFLMQCREEQFRYHIFSIRDREQLEIDLCIIDDRTETIYLIEFKSSSKKYGKWFNDPVLNEYLKPFKNVFKFVIFKERTEDFNDVSNDTTIRKILADDFLLNFNEYIV